MCVEEVLFVLRAYDSKSELCCRVSIVRENDNRQNDLHGRPHSLRPHFSTLYTYANEQFRLSSQSTGIFDAKLKNDNEKTSSRVLPFDFAYSLIAF